DEIMAQISTNYGNPTSHLDSLLPKALWRDENDWLVSVWQEERNYVYIWDEIAGYEVRNRVHAEVVSAFALRSTIGYVRADFIGDNIYACETERMSNEASVF